MRDQPISIGLPRKDIHRRAFACRCFAVARNAPAQVPATTGAHHFDLLVFSTLLDPLFMHRRNRGASDGGWSEWRIQFGVPRINRRATYRVACSIARHISIKQCLTVILEIHIPFRPLYYYDPAGCALSSSQPVLTTARSRVADIGEAFSLRQGLMPVRCARKVSCDAATFTEWARRRRPPQ